MAVLTLKEARERGLVEELKKKCDEMDLSVRAANALTNGTRDGHVLPPIDFIWQLVEQSEATILKRKNLGRKSLNEIKLVLREDYGGLELDMRLTDALKREIGAPIKADDPHEDVEPATELSVPPEGLPSLEELQKKLAAANEAIDDTEHEISAAKAKLAQQEDLKRSLEFAIKNYTTIALALS